MFLDYFKSVLYEIGQIMTTWGEREWSIAFIGLIGLGYMFLRGSGAKKSI